MSVLTRHHVKVSGQGDRAMLFAHGFGCDQSMWRYVAPAFERDFRVVLFDHVGAGKSDYSAYDRRRYSSLHGYAQDVVTICKELRIEDGVFVGHSVSAMIGMLAAIKAPRCFSKLALVGPSPCYVADAAYEGGFTRDQIEELLDFLDSNYLGWSDAMAPQIMGNADRPELSRELTDSFCRADPDIAKQFARVTFLSDNRSDIPRVPGECLILQCAQDVIAPTAVGHFLHSHLPHSTLVQLEATGHCPNLSAPEETAAAIRAFLGVS